MMIRYFIDLASILVDDGVLHRWSIILDVGRVDTVIQLKPEARAMAVTNFMTFYCSHLIF